MVLKRRDKRTTRAIIVELFYPRGGWRRATSYVMHRLRRLPDPPHRIARGVAAGVFISFTPLFGLHLIGAAGIAWLIRGNVLAALMGTFLGNPLTTPLIMSLSVELGNWMLGKPDVMLLPQIISAFGSATVEIWYNFTAIFTASKTHWERLHWFFDRVFWPYLVGGLLPGLVAGAISYYLTLPLVAAYQKLRAKRLKDRYEKMRGMAADRMAADRRDPADAASAAPAKE